MFNCACNRIEFHMQTLHHCSLQAETTSVCHRKVYPVSKQLLSTKRFKEKNWRVPYFPEEHTGLISNIPFSAAEPVGGAPLLSVTQVPNYTAWWQRHVCEQLAHGRYPSPWLVYTCVYSRPICSYQWLLGSHKNVTYRIAPSVESDWERMTFCFCLLMIRPTVVTFGFVYVAYFSRDYSGLGCVSQRLPKETIWRLLKEGFYSMAALPVAEPTVSK